MAEGVQGDALWTVERDSLCDFQYGELVRLVNLQGDPALNGTIARVASQPDAVREKGRVRVVPCDADGAPLLASLKGAAFKGLSPPTCGYGQQ
eukprot:COSAG06_NODE_10285_length_1711_cov_1.209057_1_plen_93_part_00